VLLAVVGLLNALVALAQTRSPLPREALA
jgi:hypothetical protein